MASSPEPFRAEELLEHLPSLRGLARALVHGDEVEDLVADTMLRAYERPPQHRRNLRAWLTATLRNLAIDRSRRSRAQATRESRIRMAAKGQSTTAKPDEVLARSEALHLLHSMLRELDDADHQLLLLRYFEGLNATQIGARLAIPPATVRTRLTRALGRLRALLRERYGSEAFAPCLLILNPLSIHGLTTASGLVSIITMAKSSKVFLAAAAVLLALPLYSVLVQDDEPQGGENPLVMAPPIEADNQLAPADKLDQVEHRELESVATTEPVQAPEYRTPKIQITVLDAVTRTPVAGAEVLVFDPGSPSFDTEAHQREVRSKETRVDDESEARRFGERYQANAIGMVELDGLFSRQFSIYASTETSFARVFEFSIPQNIEVYKCELLLRPRINLAVQVRFADGEPVPMVDVKFMAGREGERLGTFLRARTNDEGLAEFRNLQVFTANLPADATEHQVEVQVASREPVKRELSLDAVPKDPIQLVIPQMVSLRVTVPEEFPTREFWYMQLIAEGSVERADCFFEQAGAGGIVASTSYSGREARFVHVEPGFQGYVRLQVPKGRLNCLWQRVRIPIDATEEVLLQMEYPSGGNGLPVRVVDPEGNLLDDRSWEVSGYMIENGVGSNFSQGLPAGQAESWRVLDNAKVPIDSSWPGESLLTVQCRGENGVVQVAFFDLQGPELEAQEPRIEIVAYDDLIGSGRVVDQAGNSMAGVSLGFQGKYRETGTGVFDAPGVIVWTGADGRFELRGELGVLTELDVTVPGSSSEDFRFVEGKEDQEFVIELGADLKGTVFVDEDVPADLVGVSLLGVDEKPLFGLIEIKAGDGRIRVQYQSAGTAKLVLRDSFGAELFRSPNFELVGGETAEPDFLNPVDLRGRLHQHRVEVLAPDGSQVEEFVLREIESGRTVKGRSPLTLVSVDSRFQAVVDAPGYALSEPFTVAGNEVVQLTAPIQLKLDLQEGVTLENPRFDWVLRCESSDGSVPDWQLVREIYLDGSGQVLQLPHAGAWKLSLTAQRKHSRKRGSIRGMENRQLVPLGVDFGHEIEIPIGNQEHATTLPLTAEALAAFLAEAQ
jgi:RNA polymerase sigma factor (sigma-70 family)